MKIPLFCVWGPLDHIEEWQFLSRNTLNSLKRKCNILVKSCTSGRLFELLHGERYTSKVFKNRFRFKFPTPLVAFTPPQRGGAPPKINFFISGPIFAILGSFCSSWRDQKLLFQDFFSKVNIQPPGGQKPQNRAISSIFSKVIHPILGFHIFYHILNCFWLICGEQS